MTNKVCLSIICLLFAHLIFFYFFEGYFTKPPLNSELNLNKKVSKFEIHIPMEQTYDIEIGFSRVNVPFEYIDKKIGSEFRNSKGLPLTLKWELSKNNEVVNTHTTKTTYGCGWSADYIYRCFGEIKHKPGDYLFKINFLEVHPDLTEFKTKIFINYNFKRAHTWQTAYIFWAQIFNISVAPIVGLIALIILIANNYKHLTKRSSGPANSAGP